jgi:hypothetical protein
MLHVARNIPLTAELALPQVVEKLRRQSLLRRVLWGRAAKSVLALAGAVSLLYLASINVLLRTRLLRSALSGDPATLVVDYENAYSITPGRVHVSKLSIRGRERTEEWMMTIDRVDFHVTFRDLLRRRFHATQVAASGFSIRARLRMASADATPDAVAALPPIPGFEAIPLEPPGPPPLPLTDANYNLWSVALDDVTVEHVREVWVHTVRAEGDMRVRGRWVFRPMRWLEVGPATVEVESVNVSHGLRPIVSGCHGSFVATIHPFDVREADGLDFFDHVSTQTSLLGVVQTASAMTVLLGPNDIFFARGEGPLDAHVVLDHGVLAAGTRVSVEATDSEIEAHGAALFGSGRAELEVRRSDGAPGPVATVHAVVSDVRVWRSGAEQARARAVTATLTTRHLDVAHAFDDALFAVDVRHAETNDLGPLRQLLPNVPQVVFDSGVVAVDIDADGSLPERYVEGEAKVVANGVVVRLGRASAAGTVTARVVLNRWVWSRPAMDFSGSEVTLHDVSVGPARGSRKGAALVISSATAATPSFTMGPSGAKGRVTLDLAGIARLSAVSSVVALPYGLAFDGGDAQASLQGEIALESRLVTGKLEVVARGVRARLGSTRVFGDLVAHVNGRGDERAGTSTDFSGSSIAIAHAGTGDIGSRPNSEWWGSVDFPVATLRAHDGLHFDADVKLTAKDATPATALVAQNASVPEWAANIFTMPVLNATAELRIDGSSVEVRSLVARGSGTSIRMEYALRDHRTEGAILADLGWIEVGYGLTDGATGIVLLGSEGWFNQKALAMDHELARRASGAATSERVTKP